MYAYFIFLILVTFEKVLKTFPFWPEDFRFDYGLTKIVKSI